MGLYAQGLSYSTLNTACSALSSILHISDCHNFGSHPLVVRFMKGVFETRKPKPKYDDMWDAIERFDSENTYVAVTSHWPEATINTLNDSFSCEAHRISMSIPNT